MAHLYHRIVSLIHKPHGERSEDEIRALLPWFSKKSQLFASVEDEVLIDILRNCNCATFENDQLIIRQNERGDEFYIIVSGKVSIYVNTDSVPDDPLEARPNESLMNLPLDRKKLGNYICQIDAGKSFGELALINKDCIRNATVVADESTDLMVVNRELFDRSIRAPQEHDLRMREEFVKQHPLFRGWAPRYRRQAIMSFCRQELQFGMTIVKQGDRVDGITIIKSGHAKVTVDTIQHDGQYPNFSVSSADRPNSRLFNRGIANSRQNYVLAENRLQRRNVELCIIGENEVIGDVEQCVGLPSYLQTIVCMQPCEVMLLDEKNFERLIAKRNIHVNRMLHQNAEAKLRFRDDVNVPLIRVLIQHIEHQKTIKRLKDAGADYRDPLEVVRQPVSYSMKELKNVKNFLPPRGALVDLYGPGTLFYRNRELRRMRRTEDDRIQARLQLQNKGAGINQFREQISAVALAKEQDAAGLNKYLPAGRHDGRHGNNCEICIKINRHLRAHSGRSAASTSRASTARSFRDWETSNEHLSELEKRIHEWFDYLSNQPVQLQRQRFATQIQVPNVTQLKSDTIRVPVPVSVSVSAPAPAPLQVPTPMPSHAAVDNALPAKLPRFKPVNRHAVKPGIKVVLRRRSADRILHRSQTDIPALRVQTATASLMRAQTALTLNSIKSGYGVLTDAVSRWSSAQPADSSAYLDDDRDSLASSPQRSGRQRDKKRSHSRKTVSVDEYKELKSRMKRQEVELANFRARVELLELE